MFTSIPLEGQKGSAKILERMSFDKELKKPPPNILSHYVPHLNILFPAK